MYKFLFAFSALLLLASCGKWKEGKNKDLIYYSTDYKEKDMNILNYNSSNIDALWFEFSSIEKSEDYTNYTLIAKSNGELSKETGTCEIDWQNQINFHPSSGQSYVGKWVDGKEKFIISYDIENRTENLTFIYKEVKKCKKGK